jgi:formate/nitrite transporter FocA (FNT family)
MLLVVLCVCSFLVGLYGTLKWFKKELAYFALSFFAPLLIFCGGVFLSSVETNPQDIEFLLIFLSIVSYTLGSIIIMILRSGNVNLGSKVH